MIFNIFLRYIRLSIVLISILYYPLFVSSLNIDEQIYKQQYHILKKQYPWLTKQFYFKIYFMSLKYELDPTLCCSLIHSESYNRKYRPTLKQMKWAISKSGAMSYWQVMPVHYPKNPKELLNNTHLNFKKGMQYLKTCIIISQGNLKEALRKYNQGINGNIKKYNGWNTYVKPILKRHKKSKLLYNTYFKNKNIQIQLTTNY